MIKASAITLVAIVWTTFIMLRIFMDGRGRRML
jgi:hypothetical protein